MLHSRDTLYPLLLFSLMTLCPDVLAPNADTPTVLKAASGNDFGGSNQPHTRPLDVDQETEPDPEERQRLYALIEAIVDSTVKKYMHLIRTQRNWLQRLLELVREERELRSRYNCSTDACIYKIQLFTHLLSPSSQSAHSTLFRSRVRRAADNVTDTISESVTLNEVDDSNLNDEIIDPTSPVETLDSDFTLKINQIPPVQDDALRLSPDSLVMKSSAHDSQPNKDSGSNSLLENGNNHPQGNNFGGADKINMERMSHEVLSEALSREQKLNLAGKNEESRIAVENEHLKSVDQTSEEYVSTTVLENVKDTSDPAVVTLFDNLDSEATILDDTTNDLEQMITTASATDSTMTSESPTPATVGMTLLTETTTIVSSAVHPPDDESSLVSVTTSLVTEMNAETTTVIPQTSPSSSESSTTITTTTTTAATTTESVTTEKQEQAISEASKTLRHGSPDQAPRRSSMANIPPVPAIAFGLNQFAGKPYENCTGKFQDYCYNAIKCTYIGVLETAVCYCRTGYTGVRCDMFNLPQTFDILKISSLDKIDLSSLHGLYASNLYSSVEATARYTVNTVLKRQAYYNRWDDPI